MLAAGLQVGQMDAIRKAEEAGLFIQENGKFELSKEADAETQGAVAAMIDAIAAYVRGDFVGISDEEAQLQLTSIRSRDELAQAISSGDIVVGEEKGQISQKALNAYKETLFKAEMPEFGLEAEEVDKLGDSLQKMAEKSKDAELGALGLSEALIEDADAADEVAKELKRYDKALENVADNYEDWEKALDSDNLELQAEAIEGMDKAYSDLLDLDYGSLSNDFLTNKDNLELMKEAANGSEEAYKKLQSIAEDDLLIQAGININDENAWIKINALQDTIHTGIDDIEVGAFIDNTQAIAAMNELINMAGMTAEQATNYLASMGVDAEVEQVEVPETQTYVGAIASIKDVGFSWNLPLIGSGRGSVPTVTYEPQEIPAEGTKMATALRVTSAKKSSGG